VAVAQLWVVRQNAREVSMKVSKLLFAGLVLMIPVLGLALIFFWAVSTDSGELTERQSIALTNAVRLLSSKPILEIRSSDNSAFVLMGITNYSGQVVEFGYVFKRTLFGWRFITETPHGGLDYYLALLQKISKAKQIQAKLAVGTAFPNFTAKDIMGSPLSPATYRGKIVLVDFWATWCVPCRAQVPTLVAIYRKYHDKGFQIIGVSLDKNKQTLLQFMRENGMSWPECFDTDGEKLAEQYGVVDNTGIPFDFLLNADGIIIGKGLRGEALEKAVASAFSE